MNLELLAVAFPDALPSDSSVVPGVQDEGEPPSVRDRLLHKISTESDLPALGGSVSRVIQMTSSDDEAVRNLAHFILSDVALTQKILRVANTVYYRTAASRQVTTISKAIFLLGFETVKTSALAMMLVERMAGRQRQSVRRELAQALCASIIGREMARRSQFKDAEEAAIAALFKNLGRLLVAAHDHDRYVEIGRLVECGSHTPASAVTQVLGCSFDSLAETVMHSWEMPETIVHAIASPAGGVLKPAKGRQEWLQQVAAFSAAAAQLVPNANDTGQEAARKAVLVRFGSALGLDQARLAQLFATVADEVTVLTANAELSSPWPSENEAEAAPEAKPATPDDTADDEPALPDELRLAAPDEGPLAAAAPRHPSGKPVNARDLLLAGVQDVSQMMASGRCRVNDLMLLVLETLYSGMGFRFATVCLKEVTGRQYRARVALGENSEARQAAFAFPVAAGRDLFHLAMENDADLMISDASVPKIRNLLPDWHRRLLPDARSFIVLPLVVQNRQLGLFYADRVQPAPEGVQPDETALIKTLKGQVLTSLVSRQ